jgi:hypothetical protein
MERFMYQDDSFERLLKQKADEYRMYPSDTSWDAIRNRLDNKNRFNWKLASFFTISFVSLSLLISVRQHEVNDVVLKSNEYKSTVAQQATVANTSTTAANPNTTAKRTRVQLTTLIPTEQSTIIISNKPPVTDEITEPAASEITNTIQPIVSEKESVEIAEQILVKTEAEERIGSAVSFGSFKPAPATNTPVATTVTEPAIAEPVVFAEQNKTDGELNYEVSVPVLVNSSRLYKKIQFYLTPSASYRVLISDNRFTFGNFRDPNAAVQDRTALGFEAGASILFPVSKKLSFRTGLQLNHTKYVVTASRYQQELATINFTTYGSTQRATNLRTSNGYFDEDIANSTLQISIPIGLEFRLAGNKQFSFNIGAGLQPSYQLHATGLLVTNDLKNYIKAPDLLSRMNVNSNLETFFRWGSGDLQFQMGPQLRYQLFSNSKGKYPVQEHLVDYGLKFGIIKTLK